jgi:DNA-binding CsgD family transcriptional regulator
VHGIGSTGDTDSGSVLIAGRSELLARAGEHLARGGGPCGVLLTGPAGIGKSSLVAAVSARAEAGAAGKATVLRCAPTWAERGLPFLSLIDLLDGVAPEVVAGLPGAQRDALSGALAGARRGPVPERERDGLALRLAVLSVVRRLAARGPVLIVADDIQWMDPPSAELLAFAARRVGALPVRMIAAARVEGTGQADGLADGEGGTRRHLHVLPAPALELPVPPLSYPQLAEVLARHGRPGEPEVPRAALRDIHRVSGGNPFYALELARALAAQPAPPRPGDPLPVPGSLRELVRERLARLSPQARRTLLLAGASARPTLALLRDAGRADAEREVAEAARSGVLTQDGLDGLEGLDGLDGPGRPGRRGVVRFSHPLLSATLYAEATPAQRHAAHAVLARVSADPIERARHLALATPGEDAHLARTLQQAAEAARERGAPAEAARLGLLAAERTPESEPDAAVARRLDAAEDALTAGEPVLARATAHEVLADAERPADRVRAWIAVIDSAGQAMAEVDHVFPRALADAGEDPRLLAPLRYQLAWRALLVTGSFPDARAEAARAAELAARVADRRTELLALSLLAEAEMLMGHPDAERTLARALAEPQDPRVACDHNGPVHSRFRSLLMSDRLDEARTVIAGLVRAAERRGAVESHVLFLRGLAETELRAGRCALALDVAHSCLRLATDAGAGAGAGLQLAALAEAAGGSARRAATLAQRAVHRAEEEGDALYVARGLAALGHARLVGGDARGAALVLRRVRELERAQGVTDPARGRWHADLAEALVRWGGREAVAEAREVIDEARAAARRLRRESVLAALDRAEALLPTPGNAAEAAGLLRAAAARFGALGHRLEEGRTRLELARVEQGRGDAAAGRAALEAATGLFRTARAKPWLELAAAGPEGRRGEPDGEHGAGRGGGGGTGGAAGALAGLAEMERRVAALVAEGDTNREIAARLCVSVKTVEATLTRVYRKLGIRSRVDVVRLTAEDAQRA